MIRRKTMVLPAVLLTAALLLAGAGQAAAEAPDPDRPVSLTVCPGPDTMTALSEAAENGAVTVDVYRTADLKPDGAGGITFVPADGVTFSRALDSHEVLEKLDLSAWMQLAQDAAESILIPEQPPVDPEQDLTSLDSGLYLLVAHSTDLSGKQYVSRDVSNALITTAEADGNTYAWYPELIVLPSTVPETGAEGIRVPVSTAGDWQYSITAVLKPSVSARFGDLCITKILPVYETTTPATFVFRVQAVMGGEEEEQIVYDDVCSLTFDSAGRKTYRIAGRIPVGASVTVTEIYAGAGYSLKAAAGSSQTLTIAPPELETAEAVFENAYDAEHVNGYGILNQFRYSDGGWTLENSREGEAHEQK